jgi:hypothetical protein
MAKGKPFKPDPRVLGLLFAILAAAAYWYLRIKGFVAPGSNWLLEALKVGGIAVVGYVIGSLLAALVNMLSRK